MCDVSFECRYGQSALRWVVAVVNVYKCIQYARTVYVEARVPVWFNTAATGMICTHFITWPPVLKDRDYVNVSRLLCSCQIMCWMDFHGTVWVQCVRMLKAQLMLSPATHNTAACWDNTTLYWAMGENAWNYFTALCRNCESTWQGDQKLFGLCVVN